MSLAKDPLLTAAQVILVILIALLFFVLAGLFIGFGALATVARDEITAELAAQGAPALAYPMILLCLVLLGTIVAAGIKFLLELRAIVKSVDRGDPFEPANADRLARMGWLMVLAYALAIATGVVVVWLARVVPDADDAESISTSAAAASC